MNPNKQNLDVIQLPWQECFTILFECMPVGAFVFNPQGLLLDANSRFCELLGTTHEQVLKMTVAGLFHGQDLLHPSQPVQVGKAFTGKVNCRALSDGNFLAVLDGIVEREALVDNQTMLQAVLESLLVGIVIILEDGKISHFNAKFSEIWGISEEQLKTRNDAELIQLVLAQLVDPDQFMTRIDQLHPNLDVAEDLLYLKDGRLIERVAYPLIHDGVTRGRVWVFHDITERTRAETVMQKSMEQVRRMIEAIPDGITFTDIQGRIVDVNDAVLRLHEYERKDELIGTNSLELIAKSDWARASANMQKTFANGFSDTVLYKFKTKHGREFDAELNSVLLKDNEGVPVGFIALTRDISERARAEEALRGVNRQLQMLSVCNEVLLRASNETELLTLTCQTIVDVGGYVMAWVCHVEDDTGGFSVRPVVFAGQEAGYLAKGRFSMEDVQRGPVGRAVSEGQPCIMQNVLGNAGFAPMRDEALKRGFQAVCALPVRVDGRVIDVLVIYSANPDAFDMAEVSLLNELAGNMEYGIATLRIRAERKKAQQNLLESEERFSKAFRSSPAPMSISEIETGRFIDVNEQLARLIGYSRDEIIGKTSYELGLWIEQGERERVINLLRANGFCRELPLKIVTSTRKVRDTLWSAELITSGGRNTVLALIYDITERKLVEEALKQSEFFLRKSQKVAGVGSYCYDTHTGMWISSQTLDELFGIDTDYVKDTHGWSQLVHSEDRDEMDRYLAQHVLTEHKRFDKEYRIVQHNSQQVRWVHGLGELEFDEGGNVTQMIGTIQDITAQRSSAEALQKSDEYLRLALEGAEDGIWNINVRTGQDYYSPRCYTMLGYEPDEFESSHLAWLRLIHPDDQEKVSTASQFAVENFSGFAVDYRIKAKTGEWRWLQAKGKVVQSDPQGNALRIAGSQNDITERKQREQLMQALNMAALAMQRAQTVEQIFAAAFDQLKKIDFQATIFKTDETCTFVSPIYFTFQSEIVEKAEKIIGMQAEQVLIPIDAVSAFKIPVRERRTLYLSNLKETMAELLVGSVGAMAAPLFQQLGIQKSIDAPLIVENEVIGLLTVHSDALRESDVATVTAFANQMAATWRKAQLFEQAQQEIRARSEAQAQVRRLNEELETRVATRTVQLQSANEELEAFAYSVSHDLRAPLRAINGYTQILKEDYAPILDEEGRRVCGVIASEARRMGQLIDDLLSFSRLGRAELHLAQVDMGALASSVIKELVSPEEGQRIQFELGTLPPVQGDSGLIRQVWVNLLSNAIKFSRYKESARIEIGCTRQNEELAYWVKDNGAGFDMRYVNNLYGVFHRLHSEKEFEGTGVGLAIVHRVIKRHGGRVWAFSELGQGATFYFSLPQKGPDA